MRSLQFGMSLLMLSLGLISTCQAASLPRKECRWKVREGAEVVFSDGTKGVVAGLAVHFYDHAQTTDEEKAGRREGRIGKLGQGAGVVFLDSALRKQAAEGKAAQLGAKFSGVPLSTAVLRDDGLGKVIEPKQYCGDLILVRRSAGYHQWVELDLPFYFINVGGGVVVADDSMFVVAQPVARSSFWRGDSDDRRYQDFNMKDGKGVTDADREFAMRYEEEHFNRPQREAKAEKFQRAMEAEARKAAEKAEAERRALENKKEYAAKALVGMAEFLHKNPAEYATLTKAMAAAEAKEDEQYRQLLGGDWACPTCTLVNKAARTACEACDAKRPAKPNVDLRFSTLRRSVLAFKANVNDAVVIKRDNGLVADGQVVQLRLSFYDGEAVGVTKGLAFFRFLPEEMRSTVKVGDLVKDENMGQPLVDLVVKNPGKAELKEAGLNRLALFVDYEGRWNPLVEWPRLVFAQKVFEGDKILVNRSKIGWQCVSIIKPIYTVADVGTVEVSDDALLTKEFYKMYDRREIIGDRTVFETTDSALREQILRANREDQELFARVAAREKAEAEAAAQAAKKANSAQQQRDKAERESEAQARAEEDKLYDPVEIDKQRRILGIKETAILTLDVIHQAYKAMILKHHPDKQKREQDKAAAEAKMKNEIYPARAFLEKVVELQGQVGRKEAAPKAPVESKEAKEKGAENPDDVD